MKNRMTKLLSEASLFRLLSVRLQSSFAFARSQGRPSAHFILRMLAAVRALHNDLSDPNDMVMRIGATAIMVLLPLDVLAMLALFVILALKR